MFFACLLSFPRYYPGVVLAPLPPLVCLLVLFVFDSDSVDGKVVFELLW